MVNKFAGKRDPMPYTLITSKGQIMTFYIEEVAKLYQSLNGGKIFTKDVLNTTKEKGVVAA